MSGARIINRRPVVNPGWLDALDIQREGFKRSDELRRSTGVSGKQIDQESADHEFKIWWDYHGADESALSRVEAKKEWLKGFRGRGWGSHNPGSEESLQEKSWREWQENFARVSADPESASITDLMRAIGYLDKVRSSIQRHAWEQGKKVDANVIAGYENEEQYYQRLIEQKQGRRNARRNMEGSAEVDDVSRIKAAIESGQTIWLRTYAGAWGVRDIAMGKDGKSVKVLLGRQRNWSWLAYGQLKQLAEQVR